MASKSKTQAKAAERQARLAELERERRAQERRRNVMVGGVVALVLVLLGVTFYFLTRSNDVDAAAAGESGSGLVIGPEDAPHELVVYEDFLCPFCGQFEQSTGDQLAELAAQGQVQVDYRPFVLLDDPRFQDYSARATSAFFVVREEAGDEVAKEFHDLLFADQPAESDSEFPDAEWLIDKAVEAGAEEDAVRDGIEAGVNDAAEQATDEAREAGVTGTPTLLLDGAPYPLPRDGNFDDLLSELAG